MATKAAQPEHIKCQGYRVLKPTNSIRITPSYLFVTVRKDDLMSRLGLGNGATVMMPAFRAFDVQGLLEVYVKHTISQRTHTAHQSHTFQNPIT